MEFYTDLDCLLSVFACLSLSANSVYLAKNEEKNDKCIFMVRSAPSLCFLMVHFSKIRKINFAVSWCVLAPLKPIKLHCACEGEIGCC
jgi:hypothetical protein